MGHRIRYNRCKCPDDEVVDISWAVIECDMSEQWTKVVVGAATTMTIATIDSMQRMHGVVHVMMSMRTGIF